MSKDTAFTAQRDFWNKYVKYRPPYPSSLFDIIYAHHSEHSTATDSWRMACDIGSGIGLAGLELSRRFQNVVISDPSKDNIESARGYLGSNAPQNKFLFTVSRAEDLTAAIEERSIDLLASAEAMMWADNERAMAEAAKMTKAGGTLAIWTYHARPYILGWETQYHDLQQKLNAVYEAMLPALLDIVDLTVPHIHLMKNMDTWNINETDWMHVRRIHWNRPNIESRALAKLICAAPDMPDKVSKSQTVENHGEDILFRENVDFQWIEEYHKQVFPGFNPSVQLPNEMRALEQSFPSNDKVTLGFPATLLLATRKSTGQ